MPRALVTGAAGSIGRVLVDELTARGFVVDAWDVITPSTQGRAVGQAVDLTRPISAGPLPHYRIVAHLASVTENRHDRSTFSDHATSVAMTANLLDALAAQPPEVLLVTSSQLVYAPGVQEPTEESPRSPVSGFAAAKSAVEEFVRAFSARTETPTVAMRLGNVIGPTTRRGVVHDFVQRARAAEALGQPVEISGSVHHRRSFVSLRDCVRALLHVGLAHDTGHEVVNLANVDSVSIAEIAAAVEEVTGVPFILPEGEQGLPWIGDPGTVLPVTSRLVGYGWTWEMSSREVVIAAARGMLDAAGRTRHG